MLLSKKTLGWHLIAPVPFLPPPLAPGQEDEGTGLEEGTRLVAV